MNKFAGKNNSHNHPEKRKQIIPVVFLLDIPAIMRTNSLEFVQHIFYEFQNEISGNPIAKEYFQMEVIAFSEKAEILSPFSTVNNFEFDKTISATENKSYLDSALPLLGRELAGLNSFCMKNHCFQYQPSVVVMTDGNFYGQWQKAIDIYFRDCNSKFEQRFFCFELGKSAASGVKELTSKFNGLTIPSGKYPESYIDLLFETDMDDVSQKKSAEEYINLIDFR